MKTLEDFLQWYVRLGGVVPDNLDSLRKKFPKTTTSVESTLKTKSKEIKEMYNHTFKHLDFLKDLPDISKVTFIKK